MSLQNSVFDTAVNAQKTLLSDLQGINRIREGRPEHYAAWASKIVATHAAELKESRKLKDLISESKQRQQDEEAQLNQARASFTQAQSNLDLSKEATRNRGVAHLMVNTGHWLRQAGLAARSLIMYASKPRMPGVNPSDLFERIFDNDAKKMKGADGDVAMLSALWSIASEVAASPRFYEYLSYAEDEQEFVQAVQFLHWLHLENGLIADINKFTHKGYIGKPANQALGHYIFWLVYRLVNINGYTTAESTRAKKHNGNEEEVYEYRLSLYLKRFDDDYAPATGGVDDMQAKKILESLIVIAKFLCALPEDERRRYMKSLRGTETDAFANIHYCSANMKKMSQPLLENGGQGDSLQGYMRKTIT